MVWKLCKNNKERIFETRTKHKGYVNICHLSQVGCYFVNFTKWLLVVDMEFFIFVPKNHSHQYCTPGLWATNKSLYVLTHAFTVEDTPTRYMKTQWYGHIKDTCIWKGWLFVSGQDAYFTLIGKHDWEYHPNITHIWVYTSAEPLPLGN